MVRVGDRMLRVWRMVGAHVRVDGTCTCVPCVLVSHEVVCACSRTTESLFLKHQDSGDFIDTLLNAGKPHQFILM